eukprot:scaffold8015_cov165-Ochromonas_danica.AAC.13
MSIEEADEGLWPREERIGRHSTNTARESTESMSQPAPSHSSHTSHANSTRTESRPNLSHLFEKSIKG